MTTKTIYNADKTKCVTINRELYTDGYNYYLSLLILNTDCNVYFINDGYKQIDTILSYKEALQTANNLLSC